jgi:arylsulfatase A-like enzyme
MTETDISNVVLITADSMRQDAIGAYTDTSYTPVIDSLADSGTVFERAFAHGNWTPMSFPSIFSSRPVFADSPSVGVTESPTLAETVSEAGLSTGGFNAANGFLTSHWGYDAGFDEFEGFVANVGSSLYGKYLATHPTVEAWLQMGLSHARRFRTWVTGNDGDRPFLDTSRMFDVEEAAQSFIEETDEPFFLWIHYMDAHTPYVPAPRYIRDVSDNGLQRSRMLRAHTRTALGWEVGKQTLGDLRTLYQAAARQIDGSIGRVLDTLSEEGQRDETAIIFASDHGEEFQEHGHLAHYPKLYDELIHVPFIVDVPGTDHRRVEGQVGLDSIAPTVTDLLGVDAHEQWDGDSLAPTILEGDSPVDKPIVSVTVRGEEVTSQPIPRKIADGDLLVSVRDRDWIYIENTETGAHELYHRPSDPTQQADRSKRPSEEEQPIIDRCSSIVDAHAQRLSVQSATAGGPNVDDDIERQLEALGYQ